jgi:hypothetical protein
MIDKDSSPSWGAQMIYFSNATYESYFLIGIDSLWESIWELRGS